MTEPPDHELIHREEAKREACWDPAERWRVFQETIAWIESQAAVPRNSPRRCVELEREKNCGKSA